ncbi:MAG: hypothetical protein NTV56_22520, partial [Alphaproteobacteria bacterium]|nr:hypothetical protein [Alphaproteobacteria bacterium]
LAVVSMGRPRLTAQAIKPKAWNALLLMQSLINQGLTPNGAAVLVARDHRPDVSSSHVGAVRWLKRQQLKHHLQLNALLASDDQKRFFEFARSHPNWNTVATSVPLQTAPMRFSKVYPSEVGLTASGQRKRR